MSEFSGKCDLFDIMMMEKTYPRGNVEVSDELECFNLFKEKTGGILYQWKRVLVTEYNLEDVKKALDSSRIPFEYTKKIESVEDKRKKGGTREKVSYSFSYLGQKVTSFGALNKLGVNVPVEIPFNTLLDIIPFYPYIIQFSSGTSDGKKVVVISNKSYVDSQRTESLLYGNCSACSKTDFSNYYRDRLQKHYLEVCQAYFLKDYDKRKVTLKVDIDTLVPPAEGEDYYKLFVEEPIDYMHSIEYVWDDGLMHRHWTDPKMLDKNCIGIHSQDVNGYLQNETFSIQYIKEDENPVNLAR